MNELGIERGATDAGLEATIVACARAESAPTARELVSMPLLAALGAAGTSHVYVDTADVDELAATVIVGERLVAEIDGNTANQPLVRKALHRYLDERLATCAAMLDDHRDRLSREMMRALRYAILCARMGNEVSARFAAGRAWESSLQLHMSLCGDADGARRVGRWLRRMAPSAFVKVPFTPHAPECLIVARDLEREGIPVNFTSTFSARQAVIAALLADVTRTNVFMGRIDEGLEARLLGAHVTLEAQRALRRVRQRDGARTQLIVASMRTWRTFVDTAGCDVYTAPSRVIREFLAQTEVEPRRLRSRLDESYADELGIAEWVQATLGGERIARLYRVEPELLEFLREFGASDDWRVMRDADALHRRFDAAGFGSVFYAPTAAEWSALHRGKLPDLASPLTARVALDTLYALHADADFDAHQAAIDEQVERHLLDRHAAGAPDARARPADAPRR